MQGVPRQCLWARPILLYAKKSDALIWNPAGLKCLGQGQVQVSYAKSFDEEVNYFLGSTFPLTKDINWAFAYILSEVSGIILTDASENVLNQNAAFRNQALFLGSNYNFSEDLSFGASLAYIHKGFDNKLNDGFSLNIGTKYDFIPELSSAVTLKNINYPMVGPDRIRPSLVLGFDLKPFNHFLRFPIDIEMAEKRNSEINLGIEFSPLYLFSLRAGLENLKELNLGMRLNLGDWMLDYAYSDQELGLLHRITFTIDL
ncbi:hypothetical protein ACFL2K_00010 [Candidatus Margulisiibacteriota bacterium]